MLKLSEFNLHEIKKNGSAFIKVKITAKDVNSFAVLTGDFSPIHIDEDYAKQTSFGSRIVHGMLVSSYISTLVGMLLPGRQALITNTEFNYANPVFYDDELIVTGRVSVINTELGFMKLDIQVFRNLDLVVVGAVTIKVGDNGNY